ncbi:aldehyde-activating protein [Aureimonas sp. Leaf454]|uniref:GFA family protein n=1 Tax=Aureimonas sp. Leaf454 TaxID=1736381 RepID=UPI0006F3E72B|nr:GFA family protein [Aureimonas sp. Leaf454]KQT46323.1 aldehyde-activating protein [Aureimonas sp. Leaf454]
MRIDGGCHCGRIRYEADIDPDVVTVCHCTDCQSLTGTALRVSVVTDVSDLRVMGEPKIYTKLGDNGRKRFQHFCGECGSPLFTSGEGEGADIWGIRWGGIRQRADLVPRRQIWCRSRVPWLGGIDHLPGFAEDETSDA